MLYGGFQRPSPAEPDFGMRELEVASGAPCFLRLNSNNTNTSAACPGNWDDIAYWKGRVKCKTASDCSAWLKEKPDSPSPTTATLQDISYPEP